MSAAEAAAVSSFYYSINNGYNKNCSELKDSEKLAIFCKQAEKIEFEEGEYHDLKQL